MGEKYSNEVFRVLKQLREEIVDSHKACGGRGFFSDKACICTKVFSYVKDLVAVEIPRTYWTFKWQDLKIDDSYKKFLRMYFDNLENALTQALGVLFLGPNGVGKTAMMCEIGKEALVRGLGVFYITVQKFIYHNYADDFLRQHLLSPNVQIILLDEVDKAYIKEGSDYVPKTFEDFLRSAISSGKVVIAASNEDEKGLETLFGQSTLSMVRRHLKVVPVSGEDFSDERQDRWTKMLKSKIDWFHPNIVEMAERRWKVVEKAEEGLRTV